MYTHLSILTLHNFQKNILHFFVIENLAKINVSQISHVSCLQVKSIQDAIRDKKKNFLFEGVEIGLTPTVGLFITMNPGYAGRTELPENLKALFRYSRSQLLNTWTCELSL